VTRTKRWRSTRVRRVEDRAVEAFERTMAMTAPCRSRRRPRFEQGAPLAHMPRGVPAGTYDAAACWRQLLDVPLCRGIPCAKRWRPCHPQIAFVIWEWPHVCPGQSERGGRTPASERARHRLARLERKLSDAQKKKADPGSALFAR
jgi:hypothetical protein